MTYYDVHFPQLGKATSKSALTTTMISGSTAAGEPLPPHFQFQTSAQSAEAEAIRIETIRYMLDVKGTFGHESEQSFPISLGLNHKGGMDDEEFFEYVKKSIMKLYPDAAPVRGRWVVIKCDSGPGRLNPDLLAFLRFHGFILYPGVPNTTAVTQETDQSYGPFQSAVRTNLQLIIDKAHSYRRAKESFAVDFRACYSWGRGSRDRVDCWVGVSAWIFSCIEYQGVKEGWRRASQPPVPHKPKGLPLDRRWAMAPQGGYPQGIPIHCYLVK